MIYLLVVAWLVVVPAPIYTARVQHTPLHLNGVGVTPTRTPGVWHLRRYVTRVMRQPFNQFTVTHV